MTLSFLVCVSLSSYAQEIDFKKRYSFAKSYVWIDFNYFPNLQNSSFIDNQGQIRSLQRSNFFTPSINIGGTHFWGHADFFVSLATSPIKSQSDEVENSMGFRAITGMRIFPIAINELTPIISTGS